MDIPGDCITSDKELKYLAILVGPLKNLCCVHDTLQEHFYILHTGQGWLCCKTSGAPLFANSKILLLLTVSQPSNAAERCTYRGHVIYFRGMTVQVCRDFFPTDGDIHL